MITPSDISVSSGATGAGEGEGAAGILTIGKAVIG